MPQYLRDDDKYRLISVNIHKNYVRLRLTRNFTRTPNTVLEGTDPISEFPFEMPWMVIFTK